MAACENCAKLEKKVEALKGLIIKINAEGLEECPRNIGLKNHRKCDEDFVEETFCEDTCWPEALNKFLEDASC